MCSRLGTQRATFQLLPESAQESMLKGDPISEQRLKRATVCHVFLPYPAHRAPHSSVIPRPGRTLRTMDLGRDLVKRAVTSSLPAQLSVDHANDFSLREWVTHVQTATLLHVFMNEQQYLFKRINKGEQVGGAGRRSLEQVGAGLPTLGCKSKLRWGYCARIWGGRCHCPAFRSGRFGEGRATSGCQI